MQSILNKSESYERKRFLEDECVEDIDDYTIDQHVFVINEGKENEQSVMFGKANHEKEGIVYRNVFSLEMKKMMIDGIEQNVEYPSKRIGIYEVLKDDYKDLKSLEEKIEGKSQELENEQDEAKKNIIEEELNNFKDELFKLQGKKGLKKKNLILIKDDDIEKEAEKETEEQIQEENKEESEKPDAFKIDGPGEPKSTEEEKDPLFIKIDGFEEKVLDKENASTNYEYSKEDKKFWIEEFTKNNNYTILDNEGSGDCFFATIRDAFRDVGKETTVAKIRKLLQEEITEKHYQESYKDFYDILNANVQAEEMELKDLKKNIQQLRKEYESAEKDIASQKLEIIKGLASQYKLLQQQKKNSMENLSEFKFIKNYNINSFEDFKEFLSSSNFWADAWAISTIERKMNIKTILLSEENYKENDEYNVLNAKMPILQCGQSDNKMDEEVEFKPDYYMILSFTGNHYKLIKYKNKGALKFNEIPYDIKMLIINKCLEKNAGVFYKIPEFKGLKRELGINANEGEEIEDEESIGKDRGLHDDKDVFMYYKNSSGKPAPGKGSGEKISEGVSYNFPQGLNWRRVLDDSYIAAFTSEDGKRWNSVNHFILGSQFLKRNKDVYDKFSLDSNSNESNYIKEATDFSEENKDKVDPDFYELSPEPRVDKARKEALFAKFSQNKDLKQVLMNTLRAKLMKYKARAPAVEDVLLMELRTNFQKEGQNA